MGTYRQPKIIKDTSIDELRAGANKIATTGLAVSEAIHLQEKKAKEVKEIKERKLNEDLYKLNLDVSLMPSATDDEFDASYKKMLSEQLNIIHGLGMTSIKTGDNAEYLQEKAKFASMVQKSPDLLNGINKQVEAYRNGLQEGTVLNDNSPEFLNMLDNWGMESGKNIVPSYVDGKLILKYDYTNPATIEKKITVNGNEVDNPDYVEGGKTEVYTVNTGINMQNIENGTSIKLMTDPSENLKKLFSGAAGNSYVGLDYSRESFREEDDGTTRVTNTTYKKFEEQNEEIRLQFEGKEKNDSGDIVEIDNWRDPLENQLSQNNWEFFQLDKEGDDLFTNTPEQKKLLREKLIDYMMNTYGFDDKIKISQKSELESSIVSSPD